MSKKNQRRSIEEGLVSSGETVCVSHHHLGAAYPTARATRRQGKQDRQNLAVVDVRPAADPGKFSHRTERARANRQKKWGKKAELLPGNHHLLPLNGLARAKRVADEQKRPRNAQT
jgi:hypothetical protein